MKTLCVGEAALCISGFSKSAANYRSAVELLKSRFGDTRIIINHHMDSLENLQPVKSENDINGLRFLYDKIMSHIRALQALNIEPNTYSQLLVSMLTKKVPHVLMVEMSKSMKEKTWDLDNLLQVLKDELEARERVGLTVGKSQNSETKNSPRKSNYSKQATASALFLGGKQKSLIRCTYCRQSRASANCQLFNTVQARREFLKRNGNCFVCLRKGHLGRDCHSNAKCRECKGRHHVSICNKLEEKGESHHLDATSKPFVPQAERKVDLAPQAVSTQTQAYCGLITSDKTTLMQTVVATVSRPDKPTETIKARLILDTASSRTFVSLRLMERLNLPVVNRERMEIKTFDNYQTITRELDEVQFMIQNRRNDFSLVMSGLAVPAICKPLARQTIQFAQEKYAHLSGLTRADNCSGNEDSPIDILIGLDQYYNIVTGRIIRGEANEPVAVSTHLGYVLSGEIRGAPNLLPMMVKQIMFLPHMF